MNLSYYEMRVEMSRVAKLMFDRRLTNAAGGNFSVRVDDNRILLSPSMMSEERHCEMKPEDFLLIDYDQNILEGTGRFVPGIINACSYFKKFQGNRLCHSCTPVLLHAICSFWP